MITYSVITCRSNLVPTYKINERIYCFYVVQKRLSLLFAICSKLCSLEVQFYLFLHSCETWHFAVIYF
jgi:hypothetical protein